MHRLIHRDRFGTWLCGIALNIARQSLRASLAEQRHLQQEVLGISVPSPEEVVVATEVTERVRAAIDRLAEGQREAVYCFYLSGLTHREAALELGVSINAVKARLHQARENLGRVLADLRSKETAVTQNTDAPTMRIVDIRISRQDATPRFGLVLLEGSEHRSELPIFIGIHEATALALSLQNAEMPRPMTYQLAANLVEACGGHVKEVRITRLVETTYVASVVLATPGGIREMEARPSDALNLAVLSGAPVTADSTLLREIGDRNWLNDFVDRTEILQEVLERQEQVMQLLDENTGRPSPGPAVATILGPGPAGRSAS